MLTGSLECVRRARRQRRTMSLPEVLLWTELRKRPAGLKFRREQPAGNYQLDVFCASARLATEVDGSCHDRGDRPARDEVRDAWLTARGVEVLRLPAAIVLHDMAAAVDAIIAIVSPDRPLHHRPMAGGPPPRAGEEQER